MNKGDIQTIHALDLIRYHDGSGSGEYLCVFENPATHEPYGGEVESGLTSVRV